MQIVFTEDQVAKAIKEMDVPAGTEIVFAMEFNFQVAQANINQPNVPHLENIYSFLAAGLYAVSTKFSVATSNVVMSQFGKFLAALVPGDEYKKFRSKVTGYFSKTFNVEIVSA